MKDARYAAIKSLIVNNQFKNFSDIFAIIPISVVSKELGLNYSTLHRKVYKPSLMTLRDFQSIANLFEIDILELVKLAVKSLPKNTKG